MKKPVAVGIAIVAVIFGFIVYLSWSLAQKPHRVEVCVEFNGRTNCKIASGETQDFAEHTAIENACGEIASGVTDSMNCTRSQPAKMTVLK